MSNDFFTTFIFPFKYERGDGKEVKPDQIATKLNSGDKKNPGWQIKTYKLDSPDNYNEYYYFHPFVREAIFNKKDNSGIEYLVREDYRCLEVEYCLNETTKNCISVCVNSIDLHLFDNQIGLLTITTEKRSDDNETSFDDFLSYNDIARRVYPPFITSDKENTKAVKYKAKLLPSRMTLFHISGDKDKDISEGFAPIDLKSDKDNLYLSKIVKTLLDPFKLKEKRQMEMHEDKIYYTPFTDDRMFVVSYYSENKISCDLKGRCCDGHEYERSDKWYRFIFVDGNYPNIANPNMMRELIRKHTYSRWIGNGSLFGMSRYSLVMLCDNSGFSRQVLKQHMKSMYYQIALIVLFQQAMLLKFSVDIQKATELFGKDADFSKLQKEASNLHGNFIKFINKYWFVEVTPQEQGIETYNQWIGLLNVEKLFNEVQREIAELDSYVEAKITAATNRKLAIITYAGLPLAFIGIFLSLWQVYEGRINKVVTQLPWGYKELIERACQVKSFNLLLPILVIVTIFAVIILLWQKFKNIFYKIKA